MWIIQASFPELLYGEHKTMILIVVQMVDGIKLFLDYQVMIGVTYQL